MLQNNRERRRLKAAATVILAATLAAQSLPAEPRQLRPGFNLFTPQQDVELGREAAAEISRQAPLVHNAELDRYLNVLLQKLEQSRYARSLESDGERAKMFPFEIRLVADKNINAFSLPGGPIFVNTAAIQAAENEAQLAGVIAHEMSHIVLRHPTNQVSKRNLVVLPALLASALAGHSLLGQLAQIGIGFTANSAMLKFSRTDEAEADYNGVQIMADAGYNPIELAHFFEHLEAKTGQRGALVQFLSDHPNPGNRAEAIADELRELPRRKYVLEETAQFSRVHDLVQHLPAAAPVKEAHEPERPSAEFRSYSGRTFSLAYPENWQVHGQGDAVTIAPSDGLIPGADGQASIGYGMEVDYYVPAEPGAELKRDTGALIQRLQRSNSEMRPGREARSILVAGQPALLSTLYSRSPSGNGREVDVLVTVARPQGLFYVVFVAPAAGFDPLQTIFEKVVTSIKFE